LIADRTSPQLSRPTFSVSTLDVNPTNNAEIFVGTGVPFSDNADANEVGNGVWFTTNGGGSWSAATCDGVPCPSQIVRVRYAAALPGETIINVASSAKVFTGSNNGAFRTVFSAPAGTSVTDIAADPNSPTAIFIALADGGSGAGF